MEFVSEKTGAATVVSPSLMLLVMNIRTTPDTADDLKPMNMHFMYFLGYSYTSVTKYLYTREFEVEPIVDFISR